ncbi:hypothetical protein [Methylobacterium frigidaeris]|nr:hypothetical protein [Methylobacterium frigidaeris]
MQLYLDCDGLLADFDAGVTRLLGCPPRKYQPGWYETRHIAVLGRIVGLPRAAYCPLVSYIFEDWARDWTTSS